jgi:hypothetical protein
MVSTLRVPIKYDPSRAVRTSLRNLEVDGRVLNIPLYEFQSLPQLLGLTALYWRLWDAPEISQRSTPSKTQQTKSMG